jgi:hypothetical protein
MFISTVVLSKARLAMAQRHRQPEETATMLAMSTRRPGGSAIQHVLIHGLFDRNVILDPSHAFDILGEVAGPVFLIPRIDEAAQLDHAFEGLHVDVPVFVLRVRRQRFPDPGGISLVVDVFTGALGVAVAGAAGQCTDRSRRTESEDYAEHIQSFAHVHGCFCHDVAFVFDFHSFTVGFPDSATPARSQVHLAP